MAVQNGTWSAVDKGHPPGAAGRDATAPLQYRFIRPLTVRRTP